MNKDKKLLPLNVIARTFYVPQSWLRKEADEGRIPCLRAGRRLLFDPDLVGKLLIQRANEGVNHDQK